MTKHPFLMLLVCAAAAVAALPAAALDLSAGYTRSDVGLHQNGDGLYLGVSRDILPGPGPVDLTVGVEYVLRAGSQPRYFSDPEDGLVLGDAEVKLHYLQPAAFVGVTLPVGGFSPRLYTGLSAAMKLSENWTQPTGATDGGYSYEDTDILGHLGVSVRLTRVFLDARYSFGLNDQLIDGTSPEVKAAPSGEEAVDSAEDGAKISGFQVGLGVGF